MSWDTSDGVSQDERGDMNRYRFTKFYDSHYGTFAAGAVVELSDEDAAWLMRDSMGGLELVVPPVMVEPPAERAPETPPHDRMMRGRKKRGV